MHFYCIASFSFFWDVSQIQQLHSLNEIDSTAFSKMSFFQRLKVFALERNLGFSIPNFAVAVNTIRGIFHLLSIHIYEQYVYAFICFNNTALLEFKSQFFTK